MELDATSLYVLRRHEGSSDYRTHGMSQGKFSVLQGVPGVPATLHRELSTLSFARWDQDGMRVEAAADEPVMQLTPFLDWVRNRVASEAGQ